MTATPRATHGDRFRNYAELATVAERGIDYHISVIRRTASNVAIIAPHGGSIEHSTSALARTLAGDDFNLYLFEGLDSDGSFDELHLTSHRFDEPACLALVRNCTTVLAVHGCSGSALSLMIGGRDRALAQVLAAALATLPIDIRTDDHPFPGRHRRNICNRGSTGRGLQLEFSDGLRGSPLARSVATLVRQTLQTALPIAR